MFKKFIGLSLVTISVLNADVTTMVKNGSVEGEFRTLYSTTQNKNDTDTFTTAVGGKLFYKLATYNNFGGGIEFVTTQDVAGLSGESKHRDETLSSANNNYSTLSQAYISYEKDGTKLVAGRQNIDTPLADGDDIRMVANSFEAYTLSYKKDELSFVGGFITAWQGTDAELDNGWVSVGENGMGFGGVTYENDNYTLNGWFFSVDGKKDDETANTTYYVDGSYTLNNITLSAQYLKQAEQDNSGVEAEIFGLMGEVEVDKLTFGLAYNNSLKQKGKQSFSGFGGGTLFTNMDNTILDGITQDRDANSICATVGYSYNDIDFGYAYGDFKGSNDSAGDDAHIVEQDISVEYTLFENGVVSGYYTMVDDKNSNNDSNNFRVNFSYNF